MKERPNPFKSLKQTSTRRPLGRCASAVVTQVTGAQTVFKLRRSRKANGIPRQRKSRLLPRKPLHRLKTMMTLTVITVRLRVPLLQKADPAIAGVMIIPTSLVSPVQKLDGRGRQENKVSCLAHASTRMKMKVQMETSKM
jgi:hypothetical protein